MLRRESYSSQKIMFVFVTQASSLFSSMLGLDQEWALTLDYCMNRQPKQKGCSCSIRNGTEEGCRMKRNLPTVGKSYRSEQVQR